MAVEDDVAEMSVYPIGVICGRLEASPLLHRCYPRHHAGGIYCRAVVRRAIDVRGVCSGVCGDVAEYAMMNACEENVISDVLQVDDRVPPPFTLFSNQTVVNLS